MTNNVRLLHVDNLPDFTLSTNATTETSLPVSNLALSGRSRKMRTTTTADFNVKGNSATSIYMSCFAMSGFNLSKSATARLRLYEGENQTGDVSYDSGTINPVPTKSWGTFRWGVPDLWGQAYDVSFNPLYIFWFNAAICKSWQLDISDTTNTDGYLEVSRLMSGLYDTFSKNVDNGLVFGYKNNTKQIRSASGSLRAVTAEKYRYVEFSHSWLTEVEQLIFLESTKNAGLDSDIIMSIYPDDSSKQKEIEHSFIGKITNAPLFIHDDYLRYVTKYTIEES